MSRILYRCKATYRHVSRLLIADYADFYHRLHRFLATEVTEVVSRLGVPPNGWRTSLGKLCSKSEHNSYLMKREAYLAI